MVESQINDNQTHPLYSADRGIVDRLLAIDSPEDRDITDLARLLIRYEGFPGAYDLKEDMGKVLKSWGKDKKTLNTISKNIWRNGFRPGNPQNEAIGSSFDTSDKENK